MVTGFDGSPEATLTDPPLTTAAISEETGRLAATILINRVNNPDTPFVRVAVRSTPVFGGTTR